MVQTPEPLSELSSPLTTLSNSVMLPSDILHPTSLSLRSQQNPDHVSKFHENSDPFTQIDPTLELKSPSRVKPKGRPSGAKNKKQSGAQAGLDESIRREPSRFEHEEAQESHSTGVVDKNSSTAATSKKRKAKQMKSHGKKEVLESRAKYNRKKRNKTVVEELQAVKTVRMSTRNTRRK